MNQQANEKEFKPTESSFLKKDNAQIPYDNYYIKKNVLKVIIPHAGKATVKSLSQELLMGV